MILLHHLIRDGRYGRARVAELGRLFARFEAQPGPMFADPSVRAVAERLVHLKRLLSEAFGQVQSCSGCGRGCVPPAGTFEGGRCCGTATLDVFTQEEVRAMKLAGIEPPSEPAQDGAERSGCLFRGRAGCSLAPAQRPARCLVYVCHELRIEIEETERYAYIQRLRAELEDTFERFEELSR